MQFLLFIEKIFLNVDFKITILTSSFGAKKTSVILFSFENNLPDTIPPVVSIISPTDGAVVSKGNLRINVSASDESGISEIRILLDNRLIKTCFGLTSCSVNTNLKTLLPGNHIITGIAIDKAEPANTASTSITIIKK